MKISVFWVTIKIAIILVNSQESPKVSTISTSSQNEPTTFVKTSKTSSSGHWTHTKILTKKGVDLRNHADKSIQIAHPPDGDFLTFIRDSSFWIDKSLLIRKLFEELYDFSVVSTAPPKWGKTINLSMFKFYCELPLDSDGFEIPINQTASHFYFNEGKVVLRDGTIKELDEIPLISGYEEHFASHPVIHISGANISGDGAESLRTLLHETYKQHGSVLTQLKLKSAKIDAKQAASVTRDLCDFLSFYDPDQVSKLDAVRLRIGIQTLTRILYNLYQRTVIIIMDDIDNYAHRAFFDIKPSNFTAYEDEFATNWERFMRFTFKHNTHLEKAFMTGVLRARDPASLLKFNNHLGAYVFDDQDLFPYYGIFDTEFHQMASKRGIERTLRDEATKWYGGYRTLSHFEFEMYSPYSVTRFLNTLRIQNYFQSSRLSEFVLRLVRKKEFLRRTRSMIESFDNDTINYSVMFPRNFRRLNWNEYKEIERVERDEVKYDAMNEELIFSLLVNTGFAAIHEYQLHTGFLVIKIPNVEIRNLIYEAIKDQ